MIDRVDLPDFLPFVMAACAKLPPDIATAYIRRAIIEFCQRSNYLERIHFIDQQKCVKDYPIWPDDLEEVVRINEVHVGNFCYRAARDACCFDYCGVKFTVRNGLLHLSCTPECDKPRSIEVRFTAKPTRTACQVDSSLLNDWESVIVDGALSQLYALPNYTWTNPQLAELKAINFSKGIARARIQRLKSDTSAVTIAYASSFL